MHNFSLSLSERRVPSLFSHHRKGENVDETLLWLAMHFYMVQRVITPKALPDFLLWPLHLHFIYAVFDCALRN
jgi:hypothetical protein